MGKLTVYFVQIGMDGYMPNDISAYPTLASAIEAAKQEKSDILDNSMDFGDKVRGNIRRDWCYEVYNPTCISEYRTSIRIVADSDPGIHALETPYFPLDSRSKLESFCEYYNQMS